MEAESKLNVMTIFPVVDQILDGIMKRLAMSTLAKDMDSWIEKRDELSRKIEDLREQKQNIMKRKVSVDYTVHRV